MQATETTGAVVVVPPVSVDAKPKSKKSKTAKRKVTKVTKSGKVIKGNVIAPEFRAKYGKLGTCGDAFAAAMGKYLAPKGVDIEDKRAALLALGDENGIDVDVKWPGKNTGMIRMNLGNVLRARVHGGERVVIPGVRTWDAKQPKAKAPQSESKAA